MEQNGKRPHIRLDAGLQWAVSAKRPHALNGHSPTLALVDLFCGCGGLTLGAWEAARRSGCRLSIQFALDWSAKALDVYRTNFGCSADICIQSNVEDVLSEIGKPLTSVERRLRKSSGVVNLVVAGPPCQGHSDLNNSSRRKDPRNVLYLKVVRAAEVFRPNAVLIENVPTVIHDSDNVVPRAVSVLEQLGYEVDQQIVSLVKLGIPQTRRRHLLVATKKERFDIREFVELLEAKPATAGQFLRGLEDEPKRLPEPFYQPSRPTAENTERIRYLFDNDIHDLPNARRPPCHRDKQHAYVSMYGRMYWDRPAQTLTSGFGSMGQGRFVHPTRPRLITPHEAARLQGFPDYFDFTMVESVTALREMIANAVPPPLAIAFVSEFIRRKLV